MPVSLVIGKGILYHSDAKGITSLFLLSIVLLSISSHLFVDGTMMKNVTLDTQSPQIDGAKVYILSPADVDTSNGYWDISLNDVDNEWSLWLNVDDTWGFDEERSSQFSITLHGGSTSNSDMLISFTDGGDLTYFSMVTRMDGTGTNQIAPGCDSDLHNPSLILMDGNVYSLMYNDDWLINLGISRRCRPAYINADETCAYETIGPPGNADSWPISFSIQTYPSTNRTLFGFNGNGYNLTQCAFSGTFPLDSGISAYITTLNINHDYQIHNISLEYQLITTSEPTTIPTTSIPSTNPTTSSPTTALPTTASPTLITTAGRVSPAKVTDLILTTSDPFGDDVSVQLHWNRSVYRCTATTNSTTLTTKRYECTDKISSNCSQIAFALGVSQNDGNLIEIASLNVTDEDGITLSITEGLCFDESHIVVDLTTMDGWTNLTNKLLVYNTSDYQDGTCFNIEGIYIIPIQSVLCPYTLKMYRILGDFNKLFEIPIDFQSDNESYYISLYIFPSNNQSITHTTCCCPIQVAIVLPRILSMSCRVTSFVDYFQLSNNDGDSY